MSNREPRASAQAAAHHAADRFERLVPNRLARFVLIGGVNTVFSYALFAVLQFTLGRYVHYLAVLLLASLVSILEAYVMQRWLVWRVRARWWRELARFSGVYLLALVINAGLLPLLHEVAGLPILLAQALILVANALGTFTVHRGFTFRRV